MKKIFENDKWLLVGRGGTSSPELYLFKYKGRLVTPFENKIRSIYSTSLILYLLFERTYKDSIKDLIYRDNPFLRLVPKEDTRIRNTYLTYVSPLKIKLL